MGYRLLYSIIFSSVQSLSHVQLFATPWIAARQASLSIINSQSLPNPCPLSRWCHSTISSSVVAFSSCLQSFPASGSFPVSRLFASSGQSIYWSFSVSPSNEYSGLIFFRIDWFDLLLSKWLSRVFSSTTVWKHQFFGAQPYLWPNSHIHTWLLGIYSFDYMDICWQSNVSAF